MKNVVVLIHDDDGQEARLQAALDVTRALEGHLRCVDVAVFTTVAGDDYGASAILYADERRREGANKTRIEERLRHEGVSWDWCDTSGSVTACLKSTARLADLIVIDRPGDGGPLAHLDDAASGILVGSRAPILAVPRTSRGFAAPGHAMIAWDGSKGAVSALREAVPLLRLASRVTIVEVADGSVELHGDDAAVYLSRHGIHPQLVSLPAIGRDTARRLLGELRHRQPDYLVMGGFGQGRLRETLFGGVTDTLLHAAPVPLLLAH